MNAFAGTVARVSVGDSYQGLGFLLLATAVQALPKPWLSWPSPRAVTLLAMALRWPGLVLLAHGSKLIEASEGRTVCRRPGDPAKAPERYGGRRKQS